MNMKSITLAAVTFLAPQIAFACGESEITATAAALSKRFTNTKVDSIKCSPVPGLFEVIAGQNVVYVNGDASRLVVGSIYDTTTAELKDLTPDVGGKKKAAEMAKRADWSEFPAEAAVISGAGRRHKLAIFTDLNCSFCQRLHLALKGMDDVEVHEYVGAILKDSDRKSAAVHCSSEPQKVIDKAYAGSTELGDASCAAGAAKTKLVNDFMTRKGWNGTPVIVRSDGLVMRGFPSPEALRQFLDGAS